MSGGGSEAGAKGIQSVVGEGRIGLGWDEDGGSGGGMDVGEGGDGQDRDGDGDGDRLNRWEDTVANIILGTKSNDPLASALGL